RKPYPLVILAANRLHGLVFPKDILRLLVDVWRGIPRSAVFVPAAPVFAQKPERAGNRRVGEKLTAKRDDAVHVTTLDQRLADSESGNFAAGEFAGSHDEARRAAGFAPGVIFEMREEVEHPHGIRVAGGERE